jgi:hypothetical protein
MQNRILNLLLLLVVSFTASGCLYSREIAHVRRDIEHAYPEMRFDRQIVVSLGPASLRTIGWIARFIPGDEVEMAMDYLHEIRRVKVGVYRSESVGTARFEPATLKRFRRGDWHVAVKYREGADAGWILYRENGETVRDLFVVVLSDEDLVVARVEGRLNRLMERLVEDHRHLRVWERAGR